MKPSSVLRDSGPIVQLSTISGANSQRLDVKSETFLYLEWDAERVVSVDT